MVEPIKRKYIIYYGPSFLYACFIFALSSYSFAKAPEIISIADKPIHFFEYLIFGCLLARSYIHVNTKLIAKHHILFAILTGIICGLLDEFYQTTVPLRTFEILDLFADSAGIVIGVFLYNFWFKTYRPLPT